MQKRLFVKRLGAMLLSTTMLCTAALPAFAEETYSEEKLNESISTRYWGSDVQWEKISHADFGLETNDGVVDYLGSGNVGTYTPGTGGENIGDRGQSYSYAAETYGDWVYIGTMYGGLGANAILTRGFGDLDPDVVKASIDVMYNGNMYVSEPDGANAGGILYKFNVKTGETKILLAKSMDGTINILRGSTKKNGKLYFVGMSIDTHNPDLTQQEITTAMLLQNGFPCVYEVDPENDDKITRIYDCGIKTADDYRALVAANIFTSTRAIGFFGDTLIAGGLTTSCAYLAASNDPGSGDFQTILGEEEFRALGFKPAIHRQDVNGGGGIYQVQEYNGKLYVVVCVGDTVSQNPETGTKASFAIVRGELREGGNAAQRSDWNWSVLAGPGGKYALGLDEERVSAGACTLQVYDDYLYIGDYNDVSSALQNMVTRKNFQTLYTNLQQSINLYRMDAEENVEKVVGDPTAAFPTSLTGVGSGFGTHMTQYTWQTTVHEGKMYLGTMDETTLLEPIAQFTNGDLLEMSQEEWESQINYIRVLLELLAKNPDEETSAADDGNDSQNAPEQNEEPAEAASSEAAASEAADSESAENISSEAADSESVNSENTESASSHKAASEEVATLAAVEEEAAVSEEPAENKAAAQEAQPEKTEQAEPATQPEPLSAEQLVQKAIAAANERAAQTDVMLADLDSARSNQAISLTAEQVDTMVEGLNDGSIVPGSLENEEMVEELSQANATMAALSGLVDTTEIETFAEYYSQLTDWKDAIRDRLPDNLKPLYDLLLQIATRENLTYLAKCLPYLATSQAGFDLHTFTNNADGSVTMKTVTRNGFGDRYSHGLRIFAETDDYFVIGTASPFYGSQLWRTKNTVQKPDPTPNPNKPDNGGSGSGSSSSGSSGSSSSDSSENEVVTTAATTTSTAVYQAKSPRTGDATNLAVWASLLTLSAAGMGAFVWKRKCRK